MILTENSQTQPQDIIGQGEKKVRVLSFFPLGLLNTACEKRTELSRERLGVKGGIVL